MSSDHTATIFLVKQSKSLLGLPDPKDDGPTVLRISVTTYQSTSHDIIEHMLFQHMTVKSLNLACSYLFHVMSL
jgi:hypothetical protein